MTHQTQTITKKKVFSSGILTTGFALFSMFFGAGNLVFPLLIGKETGSNWPYAIFGLTLTAVIVPFLGLVGMLFFGAECQKFLGRIGKWPGILLFLLLQMILGPFGVIPRLFTLMHAILRPYLFDIPIGIFSLVVSLTIFITAIKPRNIIKLLGLFLTPILLICLLSLFFSGLWNSPETSIHGGSAWISFKKGLLGGYNTMDLIAAFLFATVVLPHFKNEMEIGSAVDQRKSLFEKVFFSSLIAAILLFITYVGICFISARFATSLEPSLPTEEILGVIANKLLGGIGGTIASITIVTACLTTAISLTSIFADYLRKDLSKNRISPSLSLIITLLIAICFANLGFTGIAKFLGPILEICYPGLIVLTILNIFHYFTGFKAIKLPVFLTFVLSASFYIMQNNLS
ncbi:MAG: branched-chain amino acid transport system II carrier protein [Simkaniaceae bacterium]|nr:branched-chain amino acid transport system II carrier protein [Simkaniaceae bacterium]